MDSSQDIAQKKRLLKQAIEDRGSLLIAFSGGVDSTLLAVLAQDIVGTGMRCVLLDSPVVPRSAVSEARAIAAEYNLPLEIIPVATLERQEFARNPVDRCYHCKKISARYLKQRASDRGLACIADGMNLSDQGEYRPGLIAGDEEGIVHPFIEAGITKQDIRQIARARGLSVWDKPSAACLASRIPYGEPITREKLGMIEAAEAYLAGKGFVGHRVRMQGTLARIEVAGNDPERLFEIRQEVAERLHLIGFTYITLDLEGYRTGSMDEVL